ncbi:MAG TPA: hypothetical protein VGH79_01590 [Gaiellaceae bacterium]|jgi:hypothetical protein
MKRLTNWIAGVVAGIAAYRFWKRRRKLAPATSPAAEAPEATDDRAEELRAKLAESRTSDEPSPAEPAEPEDSLEERRRRVHEDGRAAIDEMQGGGEER